MILAALIVSSLARSLEGIPGVLAPPTNVRFERSPLSGTYYDMYRNGRKIEYPENGRFDRVTILRLSIESERPMSPLEDFVPVSVYDRLGRPLFFVDQPIGREISLSLVNLHKHEDYFLVLQGEGYAMTRMRLHGDALDKGMVDLGTVWVKQSR
ncbi:MAG TPA: hypothetical protein VNI20_06075 [Fimbriimonadaceae bacterium]|nr:hypothetical protein [Fimbriimonadaceae bacterium]